MFSVVIPLYNKEKAIRQTIQSVLNQTYTDFELIIVDDGSTDNSLEIARSFSDERIRLITQHNKGVSAARNTGIRAAEWPFVAFLDADDLWEPDYLAEMAQLISRFPDAAMYGCALDKLDGGKPHKLDYKLPSGYMGYVQPYFEQARKHPLFWTSAVVINKRVTANTAYFNESIHYGEDIDLWMRIAYQFRVVFCDKVLVHYNLDAENRAMRRKIPYNKSVLSCLNTYREMEKQNISFRRYMNLLRIQFIPELFLHYQITDREMIDYLKTINGYRQSIRHRLFLSIPFRLKKKVIKWLYGGRFP